MGGPSAGDAIIAEEAPVREYDRQHVVSCLAQLPLDSNLALFYCSILQDYTGLSQCLAMNRCLARVVVTSLGKSGNSRNAPANIQPTMAVGQRSCHIPTRTDYTNEGLKVQVGRSRLGRSLTTLTKIWHYKYYEDTAPCGSSRPLAEE